MLPDGMFWNERRRIVILAAQHRLPAMYEEREYVCDGGLIPTGVTFPGISGRLRDTSTGSSRAPSPPTCRSSSRRGSNSSSA